MSKELEDLVALRGRVALVVNLEWAEQVVQLANQASLVKGVLGEWAGAKTKSSLLKSTLKTAVIVTHIVTAPV